MDPGVLAATLGLLRTRLKCLISMLITESSSSKSEISLAPSTTTRLDMFMTTGIIPTIQNRATADKMASTLLPPLQRKNFTSWEISTISECTQRIAKIHTPQHLYLFGKVPLSSAQLDGLTSSVLGTSISQLSMLEPIRFRFRLVGKEWMSKITL